MIAPVGVVRLSGPGGTNSYLVQSGGQTGLIDPYPGLHPALLPKESQPAAIFITHLQSEHGAGCSGFPGIPVYLAGESHWLCRGDAVYANSPETWKDPWSWDNRGNMPGQLAGARNERPCFIEPDRLRTVSPGQNVMGFEVMATPGHGKDAQTFLLDTGSELLAFCGDLFHQGARLWNWYDCEWDYGLETGPRRLRDSLLRLEAREPTWVLPSHGPPVHHPAAEIMELRCRLDAVLVPVGAHSDPAINIDDRDSPANGFREITPHIHQWRAGNTILILSGQGHAIVVDDGLCLWRPWEEKARTHDQIFDQAFDALGIRCVDFIVATHFHGDHVDLMGRLSLKTGAPVVTLPEIADVLEHPTKFNLACMLPWYGTPEPVVRVDERIADGTIRTWRGISIEFFLLGGQTGRHLGIAARIDGMKTVIVGDAWYGTSPAPFPPLCWNDAPPRTRGWVFALDHLIARKPDLLVAGHGCVLMNPLSLLLEARRQWEPRLQAFDLLNPHPTEEAFFSPFHPAGT